MLKNRIFLFIAMSPVGSGFSGGDRIFVELIKQLQVRKFPVTILTWKAGDRMLKENNASEKGVEKIVLQLQPWEKLGFLACYIGRIIKSSLWAFIYKLPNSNVVLYACSDFWMDVFPAVILKLRYPQSTFVATWFQTAPNPFKGFAEGKRKEKYRLSALFYYLSQLPVKPFLNIYADMILVNNEDERKRFPRHSKEGRIMVFIGAVNNKRIKDWIAKHKNLKKVYDAVYQGRLHPQKGPVELIEIWKKVVEKRPEAKLAMIGDGPLRQKVEEGVKQYHLENNVKVFGHLFDGDEKFKTFYQSRIVVHPAFYDSGGMAAAEAMAFGSPCVGFNLKAYESYYPKGMLKAKVGDTSDFAKKIISLMTDKTLYSQTKRNALELVAHKWGWEERATEFLDIINRVEKHV